MNRLMPYIYMYIYRYFWVFYSWDKTYIQHAHWHKKWLCYKKISINKCKKNLQNKLTFILTTFSQYSNWVLAKAKDKYFIYFPKSTCNKLNTLFKWRYFTVYNLIHNFYIFNFQKKENKLKSSVFPFYHLSHEQSYPKFTQGVIIYSKCTAFQYKKCRSSS